MKILHIFKNQPDKVTETLVQGWDEQNEVTRFYLYKRPVDYSRLLDLIFENEKVLCWG